jgi:hypothetical protein
MDYKSARLVGASGKLNKNKGVMFIGADGNSTTLGFKGLSGGNWVDSTATLTLTTGQRSVIIPVSVYGVTLGTGSVFELN